MALDADTRQLFQDRVKRLRESLRRGTTDRGTPYDDEDIRVFKIQIDVLSKQLKEGTDE